MVPNPPGRAAAPRYPRRVATEHVEEPPATGQEKGLVAGGSLLNVRNLGAFAIVHSVLFTGLMICAFILAKPQPATFVFGFLHGVLYMVMAALCLVAARRRIVTATTALVVVIVGAMGPYFGAYEFLREDRRQRRAQALAAEE